MKRIILICFYVFVSLLFAIYSANRMITYKERNDTEAYYQQYSCYTTSEKNDCYSLASEAGLVAFNALFSSFSSVSAVFLDNDFSFRLLIFLIALSVVGVSCHFCIKYLNYPILAMPLLFLEPKLVELSANTLKQGVAYIFILIVFDSLLSSRRLTILFKVAALMSHVTGFLSFFLIKRRLGWKIFSLIAVAIAMNMFGVMGWLANIMNYGKLSYYTALAEEETTTFISSFSMLYLIVLLCSLFLYRDRRSDVPWNVSFNFIMFCVCLFIVTYSIGIGYRFLFYIGPFILILVDRLLLFIKVRFNYGAMCFAYIIILVLYFYRAWNNYDMFINHLA